MIRLCRRGILDPLLAVRTEHASGGFEREVLRSFAGAQASHGGFVDRRGIVARPRTAPLGMSAASAQAAAAAPWDAWTGCMDGMGSEGNRGPEADEARWVAGMHQMQMRARGAGPGRAMWWWLEVTLTAMRERYIHTKGKRPTSRKCERLRRGAVLLVSLDYFLVLVCSSVCLSRLSTAAGQMVLFRPSLRHYRSRRTPQADTQFPRHNGNDMSVLPRTCLL